jgi:hypothetical protein
MPPLFFGRYRDIAKQIAERLKAGRGTDPFQPWSEEVIVASRGMADAIARELRPVAALRLQSLETLARRILNDAGEYPRVASDAERRLAMRSAARSIDHPLTTTRGIAAMLERSYRDMRDSGLALDDLRRRSERARVRNRDRLRVVIRAFAEYERLIEAIGAIDPADLFTRAANVKCETPQIIAGFYDMTGVQLRFVKSLDVSATYVPTTEKFAEPFVAEFGNLSPQSSVLSPWSVNAFDRADLEIRAICEQVAKLDGEIGIVTRSLDPYDVHLFNRYGVVAKQDTPLLAHRLGRAIATILRLRERGFPRGDVLEIVRDGFRAETSINLDEADQKTRQKRIAGGTSQELRSAQRRPRAVDDYIALVAELESLTMKLDAPLRGSDWSELLATIVSRFKFEDERDLRAAEEVDKVIALFERADRMNVRFDATAVIDALEQIAMTDDVEGAVWIGDVMKFRGRTFDHLFVFQMQDDAFPQRRIEDVLLPDSDRRLLGIREIGDGTDEERLLFRLLFDGADHVHFSFAASDGFGKALRPSQLLKNFVIEQRPAEKAALLENFASAFQWRIGASPVRTGEGAYPPPQRPLQLLARAGTRSLFDGFITDVTPFARALETVTPTQLEDFGECPQKFLFEHILGVDELDDPERELQINHRDKGSIDHRILERFYSTMTPDDYDAAERERPMLPESLIARLNDGVDAEFDRLEAEAPPFNRNIRAIERSATKRILRDFVARDLADLIANGLRPQHFEYTFGAKFAAREYRVDHPEPFIVHAAGIPIRVEGKIDRVDRDGARFRIVDYKSGKALRHKDLGKKIDRGVRLQLAIYAMAVAEFFGAEASDVCGTIKPIVAGDTNASSFAFELKDKTWGLQETLDIFASAILRGRFPAFPNEKDAEFNSCKYCAVNHSCRTKHDLEEKYAVTRSREPRTLLQEIE